jgi:hypothetical protein
MWDLVLGLLLSDHVLGLLLTVQVMGLQLSVQVLGRLTETASAMMLAALMVPLTSATSSAKLAVSM